MCTKIVFFFGKHVIVVTVWCRSGGALVFSCGSALGCHTIENQEWRIFASPISLPFFFFFACLNTIYTVRLPKYKKKKCSTKHQNHATKAKQQNLLAWAVHLLLYYYFFFFTETRVNKWTNWTNSVLLMKHTHTHTHALPCAHKMQILAGNHAHRDII